MTLSAEQFSLELTRPQLAIESDVFRTDDSRYITDTHSL